MNVDIRPAATRAARLFKITTHTDYAAGQTMTSVFDAADRDDMARRWASWHAELAGATDYASLVTIHSAKTGDTISIEEIQESDIPADDLEYDRRIKTSL